MQAAAGKGTANTVLAVGCGLTKDCDVKLPGKWKFIPAEKQLLGALATPRHLLVTLPDALAKCKPEVVLLFGETDAQRKPTQAEKNDWDDLALLCMRLGAVPVLAIPKAGANQDQDEVRNAMTTAATDPGSPGWPAFEATVTAASTDLLRVRLTDVLHLCDTHIFCRSPIASPDKTPEGKHGAIDE